MRELDGTLVTALLLEIAWEPLDAVNVALFLYDLVEHLGVLHRAYGERRREVVAIQFLGESCGFSKAELKAFAAALASFGFFFEPAGNIVKLFRVVFAFDKRNWVLCLKFSDKALDFVHAMLVFFGGGDVRVVVEKCNLEVLGKVFDGVAAARRATRMQQERRHFTRAFKPAYDAVQIDLVIVLGMAFVMPDLVGYLLFALNNVRLILFGHILLPA